ncbi:hypothetical protein PG995_007470 [Apiospora arundinis]
MTVSESDDLSMPGWPSWPIGDWPFDIEGPMTEIPKSPLTEAWSPRSQYATPSNDSLIQDPSMRGYRSEIPVVDESMTIDPAAYITTLPDEEHSPNMPCADLKSKNKRAQGNPTGWDSDTDTELRGNVKRAKYSSGNQETKTETVYYACPFLKMYPHKHRDCSKFEFKRVRDVKQHLNRIHRTPDFYCARCYATFPGAKERDEHARDAQCQNVQADFRFEGITQVQKELLMQNKTRNKSHEEQWFLIWDIVFPGASRPDSVYRCNAEEEAVVLLRDVWNERHREFLADIKPPIITPETTIYSLMEKIFDRLAREFKVTNPQARKSSKHLARVATTRDYTKLPLESTGGPGKNS